MQLLDRNRPPNLLRVARRWLTGRSVGHRLLRLGALVGLIAAGLAGHVLDAAAQTVVFRRGRRGLPAADEVVERVLARGRYQVLTRDTILGAGDVIAGDVVLLQATLRIEGQIEGDVIGVQSDVFARPGGQIDGTVVVLGGGFYGSSLAKLGSFPVDASRFGYEVEEGEAGGYVIRGPGAGTELRLPGLYGLEFPTYDRVNGLTLGWYVEYQGGQLGWLPEARGRIGYRSERGDVDGDLELRWPFGRLALSVRGGLTVRSNDGWINGDIENSLYSLIGGLDTRNYYEARFAEARLHLGHGTRLRWSHDLAAGWERARSLVNRDPFSVFSARGGFQQNPAVREADIASLAFASEVQTSDRSPLSLEFSSILEVAERDVAGNLSFTLLAATARGEIGTLGDQSLILQGFGQIPGSTGAPRQRWRALGGWGTLPTLVPGERWGDSAWWLAATYRVSLPWGLGALGRVVAWLEYAAGNAWVDDDEQRPPAVHNLGLGVSLGRLEAAVFADPDDEFKTFLALGFAPARWPGWGR